jgi:hypothetical protein
MLAALGPYRVVRLLGSGAMGQVYEVTHPDMERSFAAKVLTIGSPQSRERFRREGELVARLDHPAIVSIRSAGELACGTPYLVFDLVEGRTLKEILRERGAFEEQDALAVGAQLARALKYAHSLGILHRDLKPENVLQDETGNVHLADFGVGLATDHDRLTATGKIVGTPAYMAPEQVSLADVGPWTDVHGLGMLLFEVLTGSTPFDEETPTVLFTQILGRCPPRVDRVRSSIRPAVGDLVARCLEKDGVDRPSVAEVATALEGFRDDASLGARGAPSALIALVLVLVLVVGALGGGLALHLGGPPPSTAIPTAPGEEAARGLFAIEWSPHDEVRTYTWTLEQHSGAKRAYYSEWELEITARRLGPEEIALSMTITRYRMDIAIGQGEVVFRTGLEPTTSLARNLAKLEGRLITCSIHPRTGEVSKMTGWGSLYEEIKGEVGMFGFVLRSTLSDERQRILLSALFHCLPGKEVERGGRWVREQVAPLRRERYQRECVLESHSAERAKIRSSTLPSGAKAGGGLPVSVEGEAALGREGVVDARVEIRQGRARMLMTFRRHPQ